MGKAFVVNSLVVVNAQQKFRVSFYPILQAFVNNTIVRIVVFSLDNFGGRCVDLTCLWLEGSKGPKLNLLPVNCG